MVAVAFVSVLILIMYLVTMMLVGKARAQTGIKAPATSGDPVFERYFRVQQNTLEQTVLVLPAMWLCGSYLHANGAAILGLIFVLGRILYLRGYVQAADKRGPGFLIGFIPTVLLILGALWGTGSALL